MFLGGMTPEAYWLGYFSADYLIFLISTLVMTIFISTIGLRPYNENMGILIGTMLTSGFGMITMSYFIGQFFTKRSEASRWNLLWQLCILTLIPTVIVYLIFNTESGFMNFIILMFYTFNPMFTLYLTLYAAICDHFH
jgi:hypothetical protein